MANAHPAPRLVVDLGGTNARVALAHGTDVDHATIRKFSNSEFATFYDVVTKYCSDLGQSEYSGVAVAVAGPVVDGSARLTNRDWDIVPEKLSALLGAANVVILNDLQAQGYAAGHFASGTLTEILKSSERHKGSDALVIGVGTGFNIAQVIHDGTTTIVPPAEAGHASLPRVKGLDALAGFVEDETGFASVEDVLSGRGLERVYRWAAQEVGGPGDRTSSEIMAEAASGSPSAATSKTIEAFSHVFGAVAGDLALTTLPFGGIYLIGGMSRAFVPYFAENGFAEMFRAKGRFSALMDTFDIQVVEDDFAALVGTAHALEQHSSKA